MNIETLMQYMSYILAGIGVLAFLVSVSVQTIKEMPALKKAVSYTHLYFCCAVQ